MKIEKEKLIELYRTMVRIRKFETSARKLRSEGKIPGGFGMYTGEEAIAAGVCAHLRNDDYITSTHRPMGHCIAKGSDLKKLMAEICGKVTGFNKGKAGPWHLADLEIGLLGANGIVGGGPPLAAGAALANHLKGKNGVAVCFFGEGASNQGTIQETMNLASVWKLPLIFVCENSSPEVQVSLGHKLNFPQFKVENISIRGQAYDMPGTTIDGNDVFSVYETLKEATDRARKGEGPSLIECKTYQYEGPFSGEEADEKEKDWQGKDPILRFEKNVLDNGLLSKSELDKIQVEEENAVNEAVDFALASTDPSIEEAYSDVFNN